MSQLVFTIFTLSVIFTVACALVSDRRFWRVERFLFSVIFSAVIFTSLASLLSEEKFPLLSPEVESEGTPLFDEVILSSLKRGLEEALMEEFSLRAEDFTLTLSMVDASTHLPTEATVVLQNKGIFQDTRRMEAYLKEKGGFFNVRVSIRLDT